MAELNSAQAAAVAHRDGPLLVVAGAGAGKTRVIAERIGRLVESGVAPEQILAVTFTNKAAREMGERVRGLASLKAREGGPASPKPREGGPTLATFHALGARILRESGREIGLASHFSILDRDESEGVVGEVVRALDLDRARFPKGKIQRLISREKNQGRTTENTNELGWPEGHFWQMLAMIWERYEDRLRERHLLDFDDLLLKTLTLLQTRPATRAAYQNRWRYLHVDEYQDTNGPQYEITRLLAGERRNLCVVGDVDQSIYSWRGANYRNLLRFEKDYPGTKIVTLEQNYRSTQTIIDLANRVIAENQNRPPKNLFTQNPVGDPVKLIIGSDEAEEADLVLGEIIDRLNAGVAAEEIAILYRANFQSRALEESCLKHNLPYQVLGTRFFDRQEVKDALGYIRFALNPTDWFSLGRIINRPPRGLGRAALAKIVASGGAGLSAPATRRWQELRAIFAEIATAADRSPVSAVMELALRRSGLLDFYDEPDESGNNRRTNLEELVSLARRYDGDGADGLWRLLDEAALASEQDSLNRENGRTRGIKLMTVHAAKGLEFDEVFVTGLEQDLFPSRPRADDGHDPMEEMEEERRLFYVAVTRARQRLTLAYAESRLAFGSRQSTWPSEFLNHLTIT